MDLLLKKDKDFQSIADTIYNIHKLSTIAYDLNDEREKKAYFSRYLYLLNEVFFAFNSILIKKYIKKHLHDHGFNENKIFDKGNKINKVFYLISDLYNFNEDNDFLSDTASFFYFFENLFRHQTAHGWIDIFQDIFDEKTEIFLFRSPITKNTSVKVTINGMDIDTFRKNVKEKYFLNMNKSESLFSFQTFEILFDFLVTPEEQDNIFELVKTIKIDNSKNYEKNIKHHNSFIPKNCNEEKDHEMMKEIYREEKERNCISLLHFSLNKLVEKILWILERDFK